MKTDVPYCEECILAATDMGCLSCVDGSHARYESPPPAEEGFKPGDRVRSPHGVGSVVGTRKGRVAVRLDGLAIYQADELRHDGEDTPAEHSIEATHNIATQPSWL